MTRLTLSKKEVIEYYGKYSENNLHVVNENCICYSPLYEIKPPVFFEKVIVKALPFDERLNKKIKKAYNRGRLNIDKLLIDKVIIQVRP